MKATVVPSVKKRFKVKTKDDEKTILVGVILNQAPSHTAQPRTNLILNQVTLSGRTALAERIGIDEFYRFESNHR